MLWLEAAQQLPLGYKKRIRHDCSEDKSLIVSHNENGYSAYCFRCGNVGFEGHGYRNLAELERVRDLNLIAQEEVSRDLPKDMVLQIPPEHSGWLARAGIGPARALHHGIGWSDRLQRIVMPLYDRGVLQYWQARAVVRGQSPKYINPSVSKSDLLYSVLPSTDKSIVVVTEDILSAIRVGRHVPACSILGTKTSEAQAVALAEYDKVVYWLDPDRAGSDGSIAGARKLSLITATAIIESDVDPKNLSDRLIREHLNLTPNHRYTVC